MSAKRWIMVNGRYLLDTNVIIALFTAEPVIRRRLSIAEEVFVPCIAIGELYFGAYKSRSVQQNIDRIDEFANASAVLSCDTVTAKKYGEVKQLLKKKAQPIPETIYGLLPLLTSIASRWSRETLTSVTLRASA